MRHFLACYNLVKNSKISPPASPFNQFLVSEVQSEGRYSFSNRAHFWPLDIIWDVLACLYQDLHNFYRIFRVLKSSKKYENIMSCTRIYVDPTEDLTGKGRKMILVRNSQSCWSHSPVLVLLNCHSRRLSIRNAPVDRWKLRPIV